jgi:hypothetical protein
MKRPSIRLSRPLYEGLPWIYVACGLAALCFSYVSSSGVLSLILGALGILGLVGGIAVMLRRRDYRELHSQYGNRDSSFSDPDEK